MDVLFCCDRVYLSGLVVATESLLQQASCCCRLHFMLEGIDGHTRRRLLAQCERHRNFAAGHFYDTHEIPAEYRGASHFSRCAFGKISFLRTLSANLPERLLVLDPDIIVQRDVAELAAMDFAGRVIAAVCPPQTDLFNSGVFYVNVPLWRLRQIEPTLLASWRCNRDVRNAEQDLLHRVISPQADWLLRLEPVWNVCVTDSYEPSGAAILHCIGGRKPWHGDYRNGAIQRLFHHYLDQTFLAGRREWGAASSLRRKLNKLRIRLNRSTA
jgi:lipopolysaccharide biosynthesis glycosyltransferase